MIIAAVGECGEDFGEAASKTCLRLSPNQERLLWALKQTGRPVVMIVHSGRPMEIYPVMDCADGIIQGWHLGCEEGIALADILTGKVNPSGRLTMSIPYNVGQIPVHYNAFNTGRPAQGKDERYISRYLDCPNEALFAFGYGLTYSRFEYSAFETQVLECEGCCPDETVVARAGITVKNVSDRTGTEVVQLYIRDIAAQVVRPVKELRGFNRVELAPGEFRTITFDITREMLAYWNNDGEFVFEPGEFDLMIGSSSADVETARVTIGQSR